MHRCHKWGLRAPDLSPSPVSEAVLSCELGSGWEILPCGFFFFALSKFSGWWHPRCSPWRKDSMAGLAAAGALITASTLIPSKIPPKSLPGPPQGWAQAKGSSCSPKERSQGVLLMLGFLRAAHPWLPRNKNQGTGQTPQWEWGDVWGTPSLLLLAVTAYK